MKLTKKQRIFAFLVFLPLLPIALLTELVKEVCYALSIIFENIGHKFSQFDPFMGEKFRQFSKGVK